MKHTISILLIFTILSCKAQSIIVPIGSDQDYELTPDYYLKDVNNEYNKFVGTWKYQIGTTEIIFKLKKEEQHQAENDTEFEDLLVGEYQYIENGTEKANTLSRFDSPFISGYSHKIVSGGFTHQLPGHCIDNSDISEIKIWLFINHPTDSDTEGRLILRYLNDNGVEKLQVCVYDYSVLGTDVNLRIDIPDGYYEFIKE